MRGPASTCAWDRYPAGESAYQEASALIVLLSIRILTMVEADMLSAAERQQGASLHSAEQQQGVSAHCMSRAMHRHSVRVAAWCSPWEVHFSMRGVRQSER